MLTREEAALVKGMRARGDFNHHIAAWLATNQGRPAEVNTEEKHPDVAPAPTDELPPQGAPVNYLVDAIITMRNAVNMLERNGDSQGAHRALATFLENVTSRTRFFENGQLF